MSKAYLSGDVTRLDRAGRAPYNFVPLPEGKWIKVVPPPALDSSAADRFDGEILLDWEALTPFYIRGMLPYEEFCKRNGEAAQQDDATRRKVQTDEPFAAHGEVLLPGTSLRGMVRSLLEIMGCAPLDPVNQDQLYFRAVAADSKPYGRNGRQNPSFEPHARAYKDRFLAGGDSRVKAGYLYGNIEEENWTIQPATEDGDGRSFYKYETSEEWRITDHVTFRVDDRGKAYDVRKGKDSGGPLRGSMICSGFISKKRHQSVLREKNETVDPVAVPAIDVRAYLNGGQSQTLLKKKEFLYSKTSDGAPCFYLEWTDPAGNRRVTFGHTPYFRLPYRNTIPDAIPPGYRRGKDRLNDWDLGQAMFGRLPAPNEQNPEKPHDGSRGRVQFFDAHPASGAPAPKIGALVRSVLGEPKPTTYQHYIVQPSDVVEKMHHWDGDVDLRETPTVRGHKRFFHRPGAALPEGGKDAVATTFRPVEQGAQFTGKIRFENLSIFELGALLSAIDLPKGSAHSLGMAKPHGFGSFRARVARVSLVSRKKRYSALVGDAGGWVDGLQPALDATKINMTKAAFLGPMVRTKEPFEKAYQLFWDQPRMRELAALLQFDAVKGIANWYERTRYLEIPKNRGEDNEYLVPTKRRPLPRASEVLKGGPSIPASPRTKK